MDVGGRNNYLLRQGVVYAVTIVLEIGVFGRGLVLILDFNGFVTSHARLRVLARAIIPDARFTQSFLLGRSVLLRIEIYLLFKLTLHILRHDYSCCAALLCDH